MSVKQHDFMEVINMKHPTFSQVLTVSRCGNGKINFTGELYSTGRKSHNNIRSIHVDEDGREYFLCNNLRWYLDELEDNGVSYYC